jgi:polysaccharide chain length determinant protein (PEP-CTERM system associated)
MFEQLQSLRTFLRMAWLYRWYGVMLSIGLCMAGWVFVQTLPDQFQVKAKVFLDSRSMLRPLLQGIAFNSGALSDSALLLSRTLLTRPNLEEVARRADLDLRAKTPEQFEEVIQDLASNIKIVVGRGDNLYDISYTHLQAKTAKLVVDELLNIFMEQSLGNTRRDIMVTQKFLDEQIAAYEKRLVEAEDRLKRFKQKNVAVMTSSQGGFFARLEETSLQLREAELQLAEAVRRRDQLRVQARGDDGGGDIFSESQLNPGDSVPPEIVQFDAKIQELNSRIEDLLINFTDKHPDVVALRQLKVDYEKRREEKATELAAREVESFGGDDVGPAADSPFRMQVKIQVAEADAAVAALQTRVEEFKRRVSELEKKIDTVPEIEAELTRLNRDYSINREQYNELLQRRELAYMSQEADQSEDDVKIKIIEPTRMPLEPTGPKRILLASVVLLAGLGAGGATAIVLSQLNPRIIDVPDLKNLTGLPVLGAVSLTFNIAYRQQRRFELMGFFGVLSGLFAIYAGQIALALIGFDLPNKIAAVLRTIV